VLGQISTDIGKVCYLALEDGQRRLKSRLDKLLNGQTAPELLLMFDAGVGWQKLDQGGFQQLEELLRQHEDTKLVIIDTLQRIKPAGKRHQTSYENDYNAIGELQKLSIKHHIGIILVHHLRKSDSTSGDVFDEISGSLGLTGVADTNIVIKRTRNSPEALLSLVSRDTGEKELGLSFDESTCKWSLIGEASASDYSQSKMRREIKQILQAVSAPIDAGEISAALDAKGIRSSQSSPSIR